MVRVKQIDFHFSDGTKPVKVGQSVFLSSNYRRANESAGEIVVVKTIGHKYITVGDKWVEWKFEIDTGRYEKGSSQHSLYSSKDEYDRLVKEISYVHQVRSKLNKPHVMSFEQAKQIAKIMEWKI